MVFKLPSSEEALVDGFRIIGSAKLAWGGLGGTGFTCAGRMPESE